MQPTSGVYPCPQCKTDLGQTIQDCLQIIPLQLSALQSCISPKTVKLSINPSSEHLYSLSDTQTHVLEFTRFHLAKKSLFISTAFYLEPLPAAPAHAPDVSQTCSLPAGQEGEEMGEEGKEGRCTLAYFPIPALQIPLILWLLDDLEGDCTALCSGPSPSWENTLFSCKHQHIITMKPVFIPSSLQLHNSCNNRLPHPFIRIILAKCCIHPATSLPQTPCKLLQISSVSACWAFFLAITRFRSIYIKKLKQFYCLLWHLPSARTVRDVLYSWNSAASLMYIKFLRITCYKKQIQLTHCW